MSSVNSSQLKKDMAVVLVLALIHAAATVFVMVKLFSLGMARFEAGGGATGSEHVLATLAAALRFPILSASFTRGAGTLWAQGLFGYAPLLANSLVWAVVLVSVYRLCQRRSSVRAHVA